MRTLDGFVEDLVVLFVQQRQVQTHPEQQQRHGSDGEMNCQLHELGHLRHVDQSEGGVDAITAMPMRNRVRRTKLRC